jgi:hypothetical protein
MITRLKLKPGQNGTKALVKKYGDALVCVRYRYDEASHTRIKTVELIEEKKVIPIKPQTSESDALVPVQIAYGDPELGKMARTLGGRWDPDVKLWYIPSRKIKGTELEKHIILDAREKSYGTMSI